MVFYNNSKSYEINQMYSKIINLSLQIYCISKINKKHPFKDILYIRNDGM